MSFLTDMQIERRQEMLREWSQTLEDLEASSATVPEPQRPRQERILSTLREKTRDVSEKLDRARRSEAEAERKQTLLANPERREVATEELRRIREDLRDLDDELERSWAELEAGMRTAEAQIDGADPDA